MEDGSMETMAEATAPEVTVGGLILAAAVEDTVTVTAGGKPSMEAMAKVAEAIEVKSDAAEC
jgi:phosphotransferase system HPr-like phosphotransfer protein